MVSNATFNTISVDIVAVSFIGKETGVHRETAVHKFYQLMKSSPNICCLLDRKQSINQSINLPLQGMVQKS
jgi:hypothetical protein